MNAPIAQSTFGTEFQQRLDRARLTLLEEFFELEFSVGRWSAKLGLRDSASPFGQRLKSLVDHPRLTEVATPKQAKYMTRLPDVCAEVLRVRNAVAHSRVREGSDRGQQVALFETLTLALAGDGAVIPLSIEQIEQASREARRISGHLSQFLSQSGIKDEDFHETKSSD